MKVRLDWNNPNLGTTEVRVYRDTTTMNPLSLPAPLATLAATILTYEDTTVSANTQYYYRIGLTVDGTDLVSEEYTVYTDANLAVETGMWLCMAAGTGETWARSYNFAATGFKSYEKWFQNTSAFGIFDYAYSTGTNADTGANSGTISKFQVGYEFGVWCKAGASSANYADFDLEIKDASDNVLAAIRCVRDQSDGGVSVFYGANLTSLQQANTIVSTGGAESQFKGSLKFESNLISFTRDPFFVAADQYDFIDSWEFEADLTTATKMVFSNCRAEINSSVSEAIVYLLMKPISVFIDFTTQVNVSTSEVVLNWNELTTAIDQVSIYRDTSPLVPGSLPAALTTLAAGLETYTDSSVSNTLNYFYLIDVQSLSESNYSRSLKAFFKPFEYQRIAEYNLESIAGGILTDETGNFDATLSGTYSLVSGKDGNAVLFQTDGLADTGIDAEMDNLEMVAGNEFCIMGWFNRANAVSQTEDGIIVGRGGGTGTGATFAVFIGGTAGASSQAQDIFYLDCKGSYTSTGVAVNDGQDHFFLVDWDGIRGILRLDDVEYQVNVGTATLQTGRTLAIGSNDGTTPTTSFSPNAWIDKVRALNRSLDYHERSSAANEFNRFYDFQGYVDYDTANVELSWVEIDPSEVTNVVIYRDTSPINTGALPTALATISGGVGTYTDTTASSGSTYYLIDVQTTGPISHYSDNLSFLVITDLSYFDGVGNLTWFDPSDLSTLWQDTAGTTAVTTDGDTVQRIDDKSSNGRNAIIESGTCTYHTDGTYHWLQFTNCRFTFTQPFSGTTARTFFAVASKSGYFGGTPSLAPLMDLQYTAGSTSGGDWTPTIENDGFWVRVSGNQQWPYTTASNLAYNLMWEWSTTLGTNVTATVLSLNGTTLSKGSASSATISTISTTSAFLGGSDRQTQGTHFVGNYYQFFLLDQVLSGVERTALVELMKKYNPDI